MAGEGMEAMQEIEGKFGKYLSISFREQVHSGAKVFIVPRLRRDTGIADLDQKQ